MSKFLNIILVFILLAGCSLLLYPTVSDWSNKMHQSRAITSYQEYASEVDEETMQAALEAARDYNERLYEASDKQTFVSEHQSEYESLLNVDDSDIMGYIDIPQIKTTLPIYHGTEESVMQVAVGHLDWTSLPVGGEGTHTVLSGHRGLPSAKLFTDLDLLQIGDVFTIHIYNETLYYEVDQITVVLPEETTGLVPEAGEDYCTLVTCTPYGVNTHRLLVRGTRIFPTTDLSDMTSDVQAVPSAVLAACVGILLSAISGLIYFLRKRKKNQEKLEEKESIPETKNRVHQAKRIENNKTQKNRKKSSRTSGEDRVNRKKSSRTSGEDRVNRKKSSRISGEGRRRGKDEKTKGD